MYIVEYAAVVKSKVCGVTNRTKSGFDLANRK